MDRNAYTPQRQIGEYLPNLIIRYADSIPGRASVFSKKSANALYVPQNGGLLDKVNENISLYSKFRKSSPSPRL